MLGAANRQSSGVNWMNPSGAARSSRHLWLVPAIVLAAIYLIVNTCYTLFPSRLDQTRPVLTFWTIAAAVALPVLLAVRRLRPRHVFVLAWVSVAAALHLIPVWQGHGCWSPDLMSLLGMLLGGGVAAAVAAFGTIGERVLSSSAQRTTVIAVVIGLAFGGTVAWAVPREVSMQPLTTDYLAPGARQPSVVWQTSVSPEIRARLVPIAWRRRTGEAQPVLAVGSGRMATVVAYNRAAVQDSASGRLVGELHLAGSKQGPEIDRLYSPWQAAQIDGDLYAIRGGYWFDIYSLTSGSRLSSIPDAWSLLQLAEDQIVVDLYGWLQAYTPSGDLLWEVRAPAFAGEHPQGSDPITPYGISGYGGIMLAAKTSQGWVVGSAGGVKAVDEGGVEIWSYTIGEPFCGLAVAPDMQTVYVATVTVDGGRPLVRALRAGRELWRYVLPDGIVWYQWAVLPQGLALLQQHYGPQGNGSDRDTWVTLLSEDSGSVTWRTSLPAMYLSGIKAVGDMLIVVGDEQILRLGQEDGRVRWSCDGVRPYDSSSALVFSGSPLVFQTHNGLIALDPETGETVWRAHMLVGWRKFAQVDGVLYTTTAHSSLAIVP